MEMLISLKIFHAGVRSGGRATFLAPGNSSQNSSAVMSTAAKHRSLEL
jgi:hypothetical protein